MDPLELWGQRLMTVALGPDEEWVPSPPEEHQRWHDRFWTLVQGLLPDSDDDEEYWMTEAATTDLTDN